MERARESERLHHSVVHEDEVVLIPPARKREALNGNLFASVRWSDNDVGHFILAVIRKELPRFEAEERDVLRIPCHPGTVFAGFGNVFRSPLMRLPIIEQRPCFHYKQEHAEQDEHEEGKIDKKLQK